MQSNDSAALREVTKSMVRKALAKTFKFDSMSNDQVLLSAVTEGMTADDITVLAEKLGAEGRLAQNPEWSEPFAEFYGEFPQYNMLCNEQILIDALVAEGKPLDSDSLAYVAGLVQPRLAVTAAYASQQREEVRAKAQAEREAAESTAIQEELLGYLTNGPREQQLKRANIHPSVYAGEVRKETARLASLSHTELVEEVTRRREVRRIKGLDAKTFRAEQAAKHTQPTQEQQNTPSQSGYAQFEKLPDVYKARSGQEISMTRKGLIELSNRDAFSFREVVRRFGADAVNQILAGEV